MSNPSPEIMELMNRVSTLEAITNQRVTPDVSVLNAQIETLQDRVRTLEGDIKQLEPLRARLAKYHHLLDGDIDD